MYHCVRSLTEWHFVSLQDLTVMHKAVINARIQVVKCIPVLSCLLRQSFLKISDPLHLGKLRTQYLLSPWSWLHPQQSSTYSVGLEDCWRGSGLVYLQKPMTMQCPAVRDDSVKSSGTAAAVEEQMKWPVSNKDSGKQQWIFIRPFNIYAACSLILPMLGRAFSPQ